VVAAEVVAVSGIAGLVTFDGTPVEPGSLRAMAEAAPHRGPDGTETWLGTGAGLLFQRGAVLADDADGHGIAAQDGVACVVDARLDNRAELLSSLGADHRLHAGSTEAEIILAAYREWGEECPRRVIGDFAFVVWDGRRRMLLAARDPLAMRSLSYHLLASRRIALATEVKQLLALRDVPARVDERAVAADLLAQFGDPAWTFHEGISNVPPGHRLIAGPTGHRVERFWQPDSAFRLRLPSEEDYADLLRERFLESTAARLRTDRPAGVLMSGGVDSVSVGASAAWLVDRSAVPAPAIRAFSFAFERFAECDERHVSRLVTGAYSVEADDVLGDDLGALAEYPAHGPDRDDPFLGGFQPLIERSLSQAAAAGVGVMLGGDRGDLLFGTSGWSFLRLALARRWRDLRVELTEYRSTTTDGWLLIGRDQFVRGVLWRLRQRSAAEWFRRLVLRRRRRDESRPSWLRPLPLFDEVSEASDVDVPMGFNASRRARVELVLTPLHIRGTAWSERTYARYGLVFADPFSDRRLVELAIALPQVIVNRPGDVSKPLMRAAMRGIVPEEARQRMDKVPPTRIFEDHLRIDAAPTVDRLLTQPRVEARGWVDASAWRAEYEAWRSGTGRLSSEWWWTLGVEIWLRQHWE
jgi:asparagine synthase (glutamine-hydrolysing)